MVSSQSTRDTAKNPKLDKTSKVFNPKMSKILVFLMIILSVMFVFSEFPIRTLISLCLAYIFSHFYSYSKQKLRTFRSWYRREREAWVLILLIALSRIYTEEIREIYFSVVASVKPFITDNFVVTLIVIAIALCHNFDGCRNLTNWYRQQNDVTKSFLFFFIFFFCVLPEHWSWWSWLSGECGTPESPSH